MISNALEDFPDSPQFLSMWLAVESQTVGIQKQSSLKISKNRNGSSPGRPWTTVNGGKYQFQVWTIRNQSRL